MRLVFARLVLAALLLAGVPVQALAHNGLVHEGCPPGQTFAAGDLTISGAFTRAMLPQARSGGGYLSITNAGSVPDRLLGAASDAAQLVQLHRMVMDGDVMKMGEVEGGILIPAGETVALAPGGFHVMFFGIDVPFAEGECVEVTLEFERAGKVPVLLEIAGASATAAPAMGHGH